eukprot:450184-Rhodomonas_salina.2
MCPSESCDLSLIPGSIAAFSGVAQMLKFHSCCRRDICRRKRRCLVGNNLALAGTWVHRDGYDRPHHSG